MAGALGLALAGPRVYGGVLVDDALMGDGRREATAADIRAALALYRRADAILIGLVAILAAASSRQAEQAVEIDVPGQMGGQPIERLLDQAIVADRARAGAEARQPGGALAVVGEQAVDIGADHAAVGRDRALRRAVGEPREGPRAIGPSVTPMCIS